MNLSTAADPRYQKITRYCNTGAFFTLHHEHGQSIPRELIDVEKLSVIFTRISLMPILVFSKVIGYDIFLSVTLMSYHDTPGLTAMNITPLIDCISVVFYAPIG